MSTSPFEAYVTFSALKRHFTIGSGYDYHKYNGKLNLKASSFEARNDKYFYEKLSRHRDVVGFLVANFSHNPKLWIGDLMREPKSEERYLDWCRVTESITRETEQLLARLHDTDFDSLFRFRDGQHPPALVAILDGYPLEVFVVIDQMVDFTSHWNAYSWDPTVKGAVHIIRKLKGFIQFDPDKIKAVVQKLFSREAA